MRPLREGTDGREPGPRFSRKAIAEAIEATGVPASTALSRSNNFQRHGWIRSRHSGTHSKYAAADVAAAMALSGLVDAGVEDREVMAVASRALYGTGPRSPATVVRNSRMRRFSEHPAGWALAGVAAGEPWQFDVQAWRNLQTGKRRIIADLRRCDLPSLSQIERPGEDWVLVSSTVIEAANQLAPVVRLLTPLQQ